jgi:hypothetical protein
MAVTSSDAIRCDLDGVRVGEVADARAALA